MPDFQTMQELVDYVTENISTNGQNAITGQKLHDAMIGTLGFVPDPEQYAAVVAKLNGIEAGATANSTDGQLLAAAADQAAEAEKDANTILTNPNRRFITDLQIAKIAESGVDPDLKNPLNLFPRIVNGTVSDDVIFTDPTGVNESACVRNFKRGVFCFVYNPRYSTDPTQPSNNGTYYREATTIRGLRDAPAILIRLGRFEWPGLMIYGDTMYCYGLTDNGYSAIYCPQELGGQGLADATNDIVVASGHDFSPMANPAGGFIASGKNNLDGRATIMQAPHPLGPWKTTHDDAFGFIYSESNTPPAASREQADGFIFTFGGRLFYMYAGTAIGSDYQRPFVTRIDPKTLLAVGTPVLIAQPGEKAWQRIEIINTGGQITKKLFNPILVEDDPELGDVILMSVNANNYAFDNELSGPSGIGYLKLSEDTTPIGRNDLDLLRLQCGKAREVTSNIPFEVRGTITNTALDGLTSGDTGSIYGYVCKGSFDELSGRITLRHLNSYPVSDGTLIQIGKQNSIKIGVRATGAKARFFVTISNTNGDIQSYDGAYDLELNTRYEVAFAFRTNGEFTLIVNSTQHIYAGYYFTMPRTGLVEWSMFNDFNSTTAAANQLNVTIESCDFTDYKRIDPDTVMPVLHTAYLSNLSGRQYDDQITIDAPLEVRDAPAGNPNTGFYRIGATRANGFYMRSEIYDSNKQTGVGFYIPNTGAQLGYSDNNRRFVIGGIDVSRYVDASNAVVLRVRTAYETDGSQSVFGQGLTVVDNAGEPDPVISRSAVAIFETQSTTKGSIPFPVMTEAQRIAIVAPPVGLHVYQLDVDGGDEGVYCYKSGGWVLVY